MTVIASPSCSTAFGRLRRPRAAWSDSLLRNSAYIMASTVVTSLLGYAYWLLAAHMFSASIVGLGSAVIGLMTMTAVLANIGAASALVQRLPRRASGREWSTTVSAGIVSALMSGTLVSVLVLAVVWAARGEVSVVAGSALFVVTFIVAVCSWAASTVIDYAFIAERASGHMLVR